MLRENNGVTLVALVITIIVLLILAGVSISMVAGDNGILTQAVNAADDNELAQVRTDFELAVAACQTNYFAARYGSSGSGAKLTDYFNALDVSYAMTGYTVADNSTSISDSAGGTLSVTITLSNNNSYTATASITANGGATVSSVTK